MAGLLVEAVRKLVLTAMTHGVLERSKSFFERQRIQNAASSAVLEVVEPIAGFLAQEGITDDQRRLLVQIAGRELEPLVQDPARLFQGSLDGDAIFRQMYQHRPFPEEVRDEQLVTVFELLIPKIAQVLCRLLPILEQWDLEAWKESLRRLDGVTAQLVEVLERMKAGAQSARDEADTLLTRVRRGNAQREALRMDLTALRSDRLMSCGFEALYVAPALFRQVRDRLDVLHDQQAALAWFLRSGQRSVLIGAPGAGKSTWLRWLERSANEAGWSGIAVRVELRSLMRADALPSAAKMVREAAGPHAAEEITAQVFRGWREQGRIAFLVDGLDEVPLAQRDLIRSWLTDLAHNAGTCPVVVTTRPLTTDHVEQLGEGWGQWTIAPFDRARVVDYIERWYRNAELPTAAERAPDAGRLADQWAADPTIRPLTGNPLLLATLLLVHVLDGSLPAGRAKLYQRYVEGMLGLWDDRQQRLPSSVVLTADQKRLVLRALALEMFLRDVDQLEEDEIRRMVEQVGLRLNLKADPGDVLDVLRERTGLLVGPGNYTFSHKSVAEFLVAEAVVDGAARDQDGERVDRMRLFRHRYDDRWTVVTFLWAGLAPLAELEGLVTDLLQDSERQEAWELLFGLLDDQATRATAELWERVVRRFEGFPVPRVGFYVPNSLPVRTQGAHLRVRSLVGGAELFLVLDRAWLAGNLRCLASGPLTQNYVLRWTIATHPAVGERWLDALVAPEGAAEQARETWPVVAACWSCVELLSLEDGQREAQLGRLERIWPACREGLALDIAAKLSLRDPLASDLLLKRSSDFLATVDPEIAPDHWLDAHALSVSFGTDRGYLREAAACIRDARTTGILPDDDTTSRALTVLERLAARQDALIAAEVEE